MIHRQVGLGSEIRFTFAAGSSATNVPVVVKDGVKVTLSVETLPIIGAPLYTTSFIPAETGNYDLFIDNVLVGSAEVVTRDVFSFLRNLEDQALGGWEWDKTTKVMTIYRQDGSVLGTYLSDDTLESAYSRQTITP